MSLSTTEAAAEIRKQLKAKGWSSRQVSVRADLYSMGSSIRIRIKDSSVSKAAVKEVAEQFERVSRCEMTGEILTGGNRFVDVEYTGGALAPVVAAIEAQLSDEPGLVVKVGRFSAYRDPVEQGFWRAHGSESDRPIKCWSKAFCARQITEALLARDETVTPAAPELDAQGEAMLHLVGEAA